MSCRRPVTPHFSSSSPKRRAYDRMAASTASMCLRKESLRVHSHMSSQASSRFTTCPMVFGAMYDVVAVHGRGEGLLLHLLADAFGLHVLQALGAHHGAGDDKAREFVHGIERLGHESVPRHIQVVSVPLYGVEHVFGITQSLQLPDPHHRMPFLCRMLLVVHVVQEAGHAPFLLVLAKAACVRPHGGLDGEHVLAQ